MRCPGGQTPAPHSAARPVPFRLLSLQGWIREQQIPLVPDDPADMRVDMFIILGIVFVAGRRQKDRVQVDPFDTEVLQVIQLIDHTLQVSAVKLHVSTGGWRPVPVADLPDGFPQIGILPVQYIVGGIPVAEAVDKDLIQHCALRPVRRVKSRDDMPVVLGADRIAYSAPGIAEPPPPGDDFKIISERSFCDFKLHGVIVEAAVGFLAVHAQPAGPCHQETGLGFSRVDPQPDGDFLEHLRTGRSYVVRCCITEYRSESRLPVISVRHKQFL